MWLLKRGLLRMRFNRQYYIESKVGDVAIRNKFFRAFPNGGLLSRPEKMNLLSVCYCKLSDCNMFI